MRLIVAVDALRPPLTGIGRYTWEIVRRLRRRDDLRQLRFFHNGKWVADPATLLRDRSGPALPAKKTPAAVRFARELYWRTTCRFNVFHGPNYFLPHYAQNGVVTVHDLSVLKFPQAHPLERVKQFERRFTKSLAIASHLITDSNTVRDEVIQDFGWPADRITAIALGVGEEYRPRSPVATSEPLRALGLRPGGYVLCVATIEPRKRIDALLAAYRRISPIARGAFPLVLVGDVGWKSIGLQEDINTAQREGWLRYLGYVDSNDLPVLYSGARLFVYLSEYEGFGLPVAEAMASGVPVLTSMRSCLPETACGSALLVDPDDTDEIVGQLLKGLHDDSWRRAGMAAGIAVASRYTWDRCTDETFEIYRRAAR